MYYFVPSWYRSSDSMESYEQTSYEQAGGISFDDMINQVRMFEQSGDKTKLIVPSYFPNLRYFMHRQNIYEVAYMNVFNILQNIPNNLDMQVLDYHDFAWPDDAEFIYTPFRLLIYRQGQMYARITFGPESNMIYLEVFQDEQLRRKLHFDDRGFLSRVDYFEDGNFIKSEYLNLDGDVQFTVSSNNTVEIINNSYELEKTNYASLEELVLACMKKYFAQNLKKQDSVIIAADNNHSNKILQTIDSANIALSYFYDRMKSDGLPSQDFDKAKILLTDSNYNRNQLIKYTEKPIIQVPPFDTRLTLGKSSQEEKLKIFFMVDGLSDADLKNALLQMISLMEKNKLIEVVLATYHGENHDKLKDLIKDLKENNNFDYDYIFDPKDDEISENNLDDNEDEIPKRAIKFLAAGSESEVISTLKSIRLIVDLSNKPDVFLQIAGISAGIPEILTVESMYIDAGKNGQVVKIDELKDAIKYYFVGLKHWNEALVYATSKIADYTSGKITQTIKNALESGVNG